MVRQPLTIERRKLTLATVELIDQIEGSAGSVIVTRENTRYQPYRCTVETSDGVRAFYGQSAEEAVRAAATALVS